MHETLPPIEQLTLRVVAMPRDTNPFGDIFGGWLVSMMDLAGGSMASHVSQGPIVLAAINNMSFIKPVFVGDEISCYARLVKTGTTSMQISVEAWVKRSRNSEIHKVTEGLFTFVGIDENRKPRPLPKE